MSRLPDKLLVSRKDLAGLLGESVHVIRANEKRWGLGAARVNLNRSLVRYRRAQVLKILAALGINL